MITLLTFSFIQFVEKVTIDDWSVEQSCKEKLNAPPYIKLSCKRICEAMPKVLSFKIFKSRRG